MTVRQRWWIDAAVVLVAVAFAWLLLATHSAFAWAGGSLIFGAVVAINWGRRRWPPPPIR
jgi:drug/metabolite transporter (DMT)-like permease